MGNGGLQKKPQKMAVMEAGRNCRRARALWKNGSEIGGALNPEGKGGGKIFQGCAQQGDDFLQGSEGGAGYKGRGRDGLISQHLPSLP